MGLGAPKRRNKLSHDPNNTAWSRSTSNFGHRILSQQGWQPGQYLGAENANHSDHYTAANASHIRILLREDNLGLGAKVGGNKAETFGLSLFSGVLGRLNGKSDGDVQKQQDALRDAELRQYQVGKYGFMNFVSGGLLVGDRIQKREGSASDEKDSAETNRDIAEKKSKKRKAAEDDVDERALETKKKKKKHKTRKDEGGGRELVQGSSSEEEAEFEAADRKVRIEKELEPAKDSQESEGGSEGRSVRKESKKRRKRTKDDDVSTGSITSTEKQRLKEEKRARKEERRKRKEAKRVKKEARTKDASTREIAQEPRPAVQSVHGGRHAVRHRYIQQKRMAGMDAQAMKEIFMIKATA